MTKTRIGERLSDVGHDCTKNRSAELAAFNEKYDSFKKTLFKPLSTAMKNNLTNMQKLETSQAAVLDELGKWIKGAPISVAENNAVALQKQLLKKEKAASEKYKQDVIEYVHEWQLVVETRVDASQKQAKELKQNLDHYEKKMGSLAKNRDAADEKGKTLETKDEEKLKRNEEKLRLAKDSYENHATDLCNLLEAVVDGAWKDLLPLLLRMMKIESTKLDEEKVMMESSNIIENLKNLADEYKIDLTTPPPPSASKGTPKTAKK